MRLWDIDSATLLRTLHYTPHHSIESATSPAFSPDGSTVALLPSGGTAIQVWDVKTGAAGPFTKDAPQDPVVIEYVKRR